MATRHSCLAVCTPGLEPLLRHELGLLGIRTGPTIRGGIEITASTRQLYAANMWSRLATRFTVRVGTFHAHSFSELEDRVATLPWSDWLDLRIPTSFRVSSSGSKLFHTTAVAERFARTIGVTLAASGGGDAGPDRLGAGSSASASSGSGGHADEIVQMVVVRIVRDELTVSIDSSGAALHRRGWRLASAKAPLRETLAAAMVRAVGWDGSVPLIDPFCGSGTIPIEAATIARDLAPGMHRPFAFQRWPSFEPGTWASVCAEAAKRAEDGPATGVLIEAGDRDEGALEATRSNARRAGVAPDIEVSHGAISNLVPPSEGPPGWIVTNPPWGGRVGASDDLRDLYARFGSVARERFDGWSVALLVADVGLARHTGLDLRPVLTTSSGGKAITLLAGPTT